MTKKLHKRGTWPASGAPIAMRLLLPLLICLFGIQPPAHAEGGCPAGTVPEGGPGVSSCRPLPGYGGSGAAASSGPRSVTYIERWGAVAMDTYVTANVGASHDKSSRAEAERIAMENCLSLGSKKCELISTYSNGCVALAESSTHFGIASRPTLGESQNAAMEQCNGASCKVVFTSCSKAIAVR
ncbi:DUF4189 domain-containing protein [Variovorax sp. E3]|uniref:DUF4189 domain-containing protein n=1 Tax=Variovorax sp. E3 TaxID=1914993 RepID=UPI0022B727AE|nr:DUF4189 domain-containing protein [Variovorax sp. E3]